MQIYSYLTGPLSVNTYLIVDDNTNKGFIVDPGGEEKKLISFVKENAINVEYIILTHGHGDHICGLDAYNNVWKEASIIAHEMERELLENPKLNFSSVTCGFPISVNADIYVKDEETINVGDLTLKFMHTPGHTQGGMSIYVDGCLFSGDTLFAGSIGRTDFPGSSFSSLKESIQKKLYTLPKDTKVYPGHMGTTTIGFEKEHNPFV